MGAVLGFCRNVDWYLNIHHAYQNPYILNSKTILAPEISDKSYESVYI